MRLRLRRVMSIEVGMPIAKGRDMGAVQCRDMGGSPGQRKGLELGLWTGLV